MMMGFDVHEWLKSIDLEQYTDNFINNGYTNLKVCSNLTEEDLSQISIKLKGHVKTILLYSQQLKKFESIEGSVTPYLQLYREVVSPQQKNLYHHVTPKPNYHHHHHHSVVKNNRSLHKLERFIGGNTDISPRDDVPIVQRGNRQLTESYHSRAKKKGEPVNPEVDVEILLVRHGKSQANEDPSYYVSTADHAVQLSKKGIQQAEKAAEKIKEYYENTYGKEIPKNWKCRIWTSTYKRARQTAEILKNHTGGWITDIKENIFLVEQQFGLFEGVDWTNGMADSQFSNELHHYHKCATFGGRFWARVPMGESRFDVCRRVYHSLSPIQQDANRHGFNHVIIVSHGVTLRAFMMCYFNLTPEWFEEEPNPTNGSIRLIKEHDDKGYLWQEEDRAEITRETDLLLYFFNELEKFVKKKGEIREERKDSLTNEQ